MSVKLTQAQAAAIEFVRQAPEKESIITAHIEMGSCGWTSATLAPLNGMLPDKLLRAVYEGYEEEDD
ncbi:hypothetical protein KM908_14275 [Alkalihalobacillus clausii]|uniref:hypothetical protein n=1 Tax=Shouchella clausii TaxID=79880 RepID=UPI001C2394EC|nr:hypothetical protein [Shouchella clausii]MBU8597308.1 hypothetical protein [Shouchella clausii]